MKPKTMTTSEVRRATMKAMVGAVDGPKRESVLTGTLADRALLADITIHMWTGSKEDRRLSDEMTSLKVAGKKTAKVIKTLLPEDTAGTTAKELREAIAAANEVRRIHKEQTLPWSDEGPRILPAVNFVNWNTKVPAAIEIFDDKVNALSDRWVTLVTAAELYLPNGMYNERDYPPREFLRRKFHIELFTSPFPDVKDFRVDLGDSQMQYIKQGLTNQIHEAVGRVTQELLQRIMKVVERVEKLGEPRAALRQELIRDIGELLTTVSQLNFTGDPTVERFRKRVHQELVFSVEEVKQAPRMRRMLANQAAAIRKDMAAFMGEV